MKASVSKFPGSQHEQNIKSGGGDSKYILEKKRIEPNPSTKIAGLGDVDVSPFPFGGLFRFQPFVFWWCISANGVVGLVFG